MKPIYKLENWGVIQYDDFDPYKAPELYAQCLLGDRSDGRLDVKTSRILGKTGNYVVTQNSLYDLGAPDVEYEKTFPSAKDRLFASLSELK